MKRDLKLIKKRGLPLEEFEDVVKKLQNQIPLEEKYKDHQLSGSLKQYRECHIRPDWLLIYRIYKSELVLALSRTGTHADLLDM